MIIKICLLIISYEETNCILALLPVVVFVRRRFRRWKWTRNIAFLAFPFHAGGVLISVEEAMNLRSAHDLGVSGCEWTVFQLRLLLGRRSKFRWVKTFLKKKLPLAFFFLQIWKKILANANVPLRIKSRRQNHTKGNIERKWKSSILNFHVFVVQFLIFNHLPFWLIHFLFFWYLPSPKTNAWKKRYYEYIFVGHKNVDSFYAFQHHTVLCKYFMVMKSVVSEVLAWFQARKCCFL